MFFNQAQYTYIYFNLLFRKEMWNVSKKDVHQFDATTHRIPGKVVARRVMTVYIVVANTGMEKVLELMMPALLANVE